MSTLTVNRTKEYNHYGTYDDLELGVSSFLREIGNNIVDSDTASKIITRLVKESIDGSGHVYAWVAIRAFLPTEAFDTPRWHVDGNFYDSDKQQYKIAMVLKGAQTLFYNLSDGDYLNLFKSCNISYNNSEPINKMASWGAMHKAREIIARVLDKNKLFHLYLVKAQCLL